MTFLFSKSKQINTQKKKKKNYYFIYHENGLRGGNNRQEYLREEKDVQYIRLWPYEKFKKKKKISSGDKGSNFVLIFFPFIFIGGIEKKRGLLLGRYSIPLKGGDYFSLFLPSAAFESRWRCVLPRPRWYDKCKPLYGICIITGKRDSKIVIIKFPSPPNSPFFPNISVPCAPEKIFKKEHHRHKKAVGDIYQKLTCKQKKKQTKDCFR